MKILLFNPPHPAIGSRIPREHLPPLGLLSLGGPLLDAGHQVKLLDAEFGPMTTGDIVRRAVDYSPDAVLLGHSGSTSGHPSAMRAARALRGAMPGTWIVYGGVFPTYHSQEILEQEQDSDYWRTLRQLLKYDPDQIQALYATPHGWTPFARQVAGNRIIHQPDLSRWEYKHQVLESIRVPNWRVLLWVKLIETVCQLRPKSLFRLLAHPDRLFREGMRCYSNIGRRVWCYEIWQWLFFDRRVRQGPTVAEFLKCRGGRERFKFSARRACAKAPAKARSAWLRFDTVLRSWQAAKNR